MNHPVCAETGSWRDSGSFSRRNLEMNQTFTDCRVCCWCTSEQVLISFMSETLNLRLSPDSMKYGHDTWQPWLKSFPIQNEFCFPEIHFSTSAWNWFCLSLKLFLSRYFDEGDAGTDKLSSSLRAVSAALQTPSSIFMNAFFHTASKVPSAQHLTAASLYRRSSLATLKPVDNKRAAISYYPKWDT